MNLGRWNCST